MDKAKILSHYTNGVKMLEKQDELAATYKYKPIPPIISMMQRAEYEEKLPEIFKNPPSNGPLYSLDGVLLCNKYKRIVIGDYGAFIEVENDDIIIENLKVKPGEEYKINDPRFAERVKYFWYIPKTGYQTKCYFQQKSVDYADYQPNCWYVSPYEVKFE